MKDTWNERLTMARKAKGLSKTDFWRLVKVSSATSTNWENGVVKSIKGENLVNVCKVLGVTEEWLMQGKENMPSLLNDDEVKKTSSLMNETWKTRLTATRTAKGYNKREFAKIIGVSPATATDWEKTVESGGIIVLASNNLDKITKMLGITSDYLLHGKEIKIDIGHYTEDENIKAVLKLMSDLRPEERFNIRTKIQWFVEGVMSVREKVYVMENEEKKYPQIFPESVQTLNKFLKLLIEIPAG